MLRALRLCACGRLYVWAPSGDSCRRATVSGGESSNILHELNEREFCRNFVRHFLQRGCSDFNFESKTPRKSLCAFGRGVVGEKQKWKQCEYTSTGHGRHAACHSHRTRQHHRGRWRSTMTSRAATTRCARRRRVPTPRICGAPARPRLCVLTVTGVRAGVAEVKARGGGSIGREGRHVGVR